jgi:hypothetical protein
MTAGLDLPKISPQQVVSHTLDGIRAGQEYVLVDHRARDVWNTTRSDLAKMAATMEQAWSSMLLGAKP